MNRDDIIRMAREAGFDVEVQDIFKYKPQHSFIGVDENIERFAALVAAAERKRITESIVRECADVAFQNSHSWEPVDEAVKKHFGVT